ncbi:MAG: hypothetical protein L0Z49_04840, partial [Actinobacteria bacterium]|nr:hypothetical protein [Actinomycetota bacterium]
MKRPLWSLSFVGLPFTRKLPLLGRVTLPYGVWSLLHVVGIGAPGIGAFLGFRLVVSPSTAWYLGAAVTAGL